LHFTGSNPKGTDYCAFPPWPHMNEVPMNCLYHQGQRLLDWQHCIESYSFIDDETEQNTMAYMLDEVDYRMQRMMIRADRFGMMESMELRLPFLYTPLVQLALNTPTDMRMKPKRGFFRGYELKSLLKEMGIHIGLPRSLSYRKKYGTPFNNTPQVQKVLRNLDLSRLSELLKIPQDTLRSVALNSYDRNLSRIQYGFLSTEVLIRLFQDGQDVEELSDKFGWICDTPGDGKRVT